MSCLLILKVEQKLVNINCRVGSLLIAIIPTSLCTAEELNTEQSLNGRALSSPDVVWQPGSNWINENSSRFSLEGEHLVSS